MEYLSKEDAYRYGMASEEFLIKILRRSIFTDACLIDGKIMGVYGVLGEYLGTEGRPWSLLNPIIEKYPFRVTYFYRQALEKMLQLFPVLIDRVDAKHDKILRMLKLMKFTFSEPEPFTDGMFIKATRRR